MRSLAWIAALLVVGGVSACGTTDDDRFDLRTPGAERRANAPRVREVPGSAKIRHGKPTRNEVAVIRGWSDALRAGHVEQASRFFALPVQVSDGVTPRRSLEDRDAVMRFNRGLPCGARLVATERGDDSFVIATFRLTERPGRKCDGVGEPAATAFLIRGHRITQWLRVQVPAAQQQPEGDTS
jgi:hypothetical protein